MTSDGDLRIAFFISSYGSGVQLKRLVTALRRAEPTSQIVIHHDVFQSELEPDLFENVANVHVLASDVPIIWGDMTLEAARWRVFRWILNNLPVDWVVLLSEQDYPIAPGDTLRQLLATSGADAFIRGQKVSEIQDASLRHECEIRYLYRYTSLPSLGIECRLPIYLQRKMANVRGLAITALTRVQSLIFVYTTPPALGLRSRIGLRRRRTPFSETFPLWYNDCWIALSQKAMRSVVDFVDTHADFVDYFAHTVIPLESATATILFNDPDITVVNAPLHAIRWSDAASGRPDVFNVEDLDFLQSSGLPFARKFDPRNAELMDELDSILTGARTSDDQSVPNSRGARRPKSGGPVAAAASCSTPSPTTRPLEGP